MAKGKPDCLFCSMAEEGGDADLQFSPSVGTHYHPACARLTISMAEEQGEEMMMIEEARLCLENQAQKVRNLGEIP